MRLSARPMRGFPDQHLPVLVAEALKTAFLSSSSGLLQLDDTMQMRWLKFQVGAGSRMIAVTATRHSAPAWNPHEDVQQAILEMQTPYSLNADCSKGQGQLVSNWAFSTETNIRPTGFRPLLLVDQHWQSIGRFPHNDITRHSSKIRCETRGGQFPPIPYSCET